MKTPEFDFRKHQNFSKNRKMLIRFVIYSVVISILLYLIYNSEKIEENNTNNEEMNQMELEFDEDIVN